jgi:cytochrome c-type biogenesis protein
VGLTLPFVLAAFFIKPFLKFAAQFRPYLGYMEKLMGLVLIFFAVLLITGSISKIANWMLVAFPTLFGV